jgi:hypothetical protein
MKAPRASAPSLCLALVATCLLSSCMSLMRPATTPTPRSEQVCDQAPPAPVPPIGTSVSTWAPRCAQLIGLYRDEITKYGSGTTCRERVRAENAKRR